MALTTISPEAQQKLAVFVPIVALAVSLFVVYPAYGRYSRLNQQIDQNKKELDTLRNTPPPPPIVGGGKPTAPDVVSEPAQFLALVRRLIAAAGCQRGSVDLTPNTNSKTDQGPVRPVQARIEVVGEYPQIRAFLWQLQHAGRLLAIGEIAVAPVAPSTGPQPVSSRSPVKANITIERYVATHTS